MTPRSLPPAAALLFLCFLLTPGAVAEDLVDAHVEQARSIEAGQEKPGSDKALEALKAEIAAKQRLWSERLGNDPRASELLGNIPMNIREQAKGLAGDADATRARLKTGVTLPLILALVAERNPEVLAAWQNWRAATQRFSQASYLEELLSQYRAFVRELDTKVGPQTHKPMPGVYPSALALKGQLVDAETEIAWLNYLQTLRKSINDAARTYFELQYTAQSIQSVRNTRVLVAQLSESAQAELAAGTARQAEALKAQAELAMLDTKLTTLQRQHLNAIARINSTLAIPATSEWGVVAEADLADVTLTAAEAQGAALKGNQELLQAHQEAELMPLMLRMAEVEVNPRASVGYSQFAPSLGADAGATRNMMATFPEKPELTGGDAAMFSSNAAYLNELRVRVKQAQEMEAQAVARAEFAAKDAHFRADQARRERKTYAEIVVPKAKQAFDTLRERYGNNDASLSEFLDAGKSYLDNALLLQAARRDHSQALADLQDTLGRTAAGIWAAK